jgi:hypothetical protein
MDIKAITDSAVQECAPPVEDFEFLSALEVVAQFSFVITLMEVYFYNANFYACYINNLKMDSHLKTMFAVKAKWPNG